MHTCKVTTTVHVSNCEKHPLMVTATFNCEYDSQEGWNWEVERISCIEVQIGGKVGMDITRMVKADTRALAIITADAAACDEQIYEAIAAKEKGGVAA